MGRLLRSATVNSFCISLKQKEMARYQQAPCHLSIRKEGLVVLTWELDTYCRSFPRYVSRELPSMGTFIFSYIRPFGVYLVHKVCLK